MRCNVVLLCPQACSKDKCCAKGCVFKPRAKCSSGLCCEGCQVRLCNHHRLLEKYCFPCLRMESNCCCAIEVVPEVGISSSAP